MSWPVAAVKLTGKSCSGWQATFGHSRSNISTVPFMSPPATKSLNPSQDQKVLKWAQQLWFSCAKVYIEHALIFNC